MNLSKSSTNPALLRNQVQTAQVLGMSRNKLIELTKGGVLPVVKLGKLNLYDVDKCRRILTSKFEIWDRPEG